MEYSPASAAPHGAAAQMVSWYDPRLLARMGVRTIVSSVFGQYADQRLMQAVTDPADDKELCPLRLQQSASRRSAPQRRPATRPAPSGSTTSPTSATASRPPTRWPTCSRRTASTCAAPASCGTARSSSWAATSAIRRPPARNTRSGCCSPSTGLSPCASPIASCSPSPAITTGTTASTPSTACSAPRATSSRMPRATCIGGWQCQQHRSYWALRLPYNWWIWGADIQFSKYLDTCAGQLFRGDGRADGPRDNLIICLAEPSWMMADLQGQDEEENFFKITTIARAQGARVVAVIAGDWHNYNRYYAHELDVHFITSGGGGAFLHPTHVLKNNISVRWPERQEDAEASPRRRARRAPRRSLASPRIRHPSQAQHQGGRQRRRAGRAGRAGRLRAAAGHRDAQARRRQPLRPQAPKCYPSKARSYFLSLGNVLFPFYNPAFAIGIGLIYWLVTWEFQTLVSQGGNLGRQDRQTGSRPPDGTTFLERAAFHAALSRPGHDGLDRPDHSAGRPLRYADLVRGCGRSVRASAATLTSSSSARRIFSPT